jgi:hypothetical protein
LEWEKLWVRFAASTCKKAKKVHFEMLKKMDIADGLLLLCSDLCGTMTFQELRRVIGRETRTLEEWVEVAVWLATENAKGRLK